VKKNRSLIVITFIILSFVLPFQLPAANAGVTDCLSLGYPSATLSSTTLTISASLSVTCTNQQIGNSGGGFLYSVVDESYAQCSGPRGISSGMFTTLKCSVPVGPPSGSNRTGYTSTTIKIWSAYDFSTKFVSATHLPIPKNVMPSATPTSSPTPTPTQKVDAPIVVYGDPSPTDLQACTKGDGQPYWHCEIAPTWKYSMCASASKGSLQIYKKKKWVKIDTVRGVRMPPNCNYKFMPFTSRYYGTITKKSGTYKYRFYFPAENNNNVITIHEFKIRVLAGGLDMDAP
jgi:hypothetical protein